MRNLIAGVLAVIGSFCLFVGDASAQCSAATRGLSVQVFTVKQAITGKELPDNLKEKYRSAIETQRRDSSQVFSGEMSRPLQTFEASSPGYRYSGPIRLRVAVAQVDGNKFVAEKEVVYDHVLQHSGGTAAMTFLTETVMQNTLRITAFPPAGYKVVSSHYEAKDLGAGAMDHWTIPIPPDAKNENLWQKYCYRNVIIFLEEEKTSSLHHDLGFHPQVVFLL